MVGKRCIMNTKQELNISDKLFNSMVRNLTCSVRQSKELVTATNHLYFKLVLPVKRVVMQIEHD